MSKKSKKQQSNETEPNVKDHESKKIKKVDNKLFKKKKAKGINIKHLNVEDISNLNNLTMDVDKKVLHVEKQEKKQKKKKNKQIENVESQSTANTNLIKPNTNGTENSSSKANEKKKKKKKKSKQPDNSAEGQFKSNEKLKDKFNSEEKEETKKVVSSKRKEHFNQKRKQAQEKRKITRQEEGPHTFLNKLSVEEMKKRIAEIEQRETITKTAARKLRILRKKVAIEEGTINIDSPKRKINELEQKLNNRKTKKFKKNKTLTNEENVTDDINVADAKKTKKRKNEDPISETQLFIVDRKGDNNLKDFDSDNNEYESQSKIVNSKITPAVVKKGKVKHKKIKLSKHVEDKDDSDSNLNQNSDLDNEKDSSDDNDSSIDEEIEKLKTIHHLKKKTLKQDSDSQDEDEEEDEEEEEKSEEEDEEDEGELEKEDEEDEEENEGDDKEKKEEKESETEEEDSEENDKKHFSNKSFSKNLTNKKDFKNNIQKPNKSHETENSAKKRYVLFIGNLAYDATTVDLKKHFLTKVSKVKDVRIPLKIGTNQPRGFAYVEVENSVDYEKGLSLHDTFVKGRQINVQYTSSGSKSSGKRQEIVHKNKKLHAMRKAGKLAGSKKFDQKRSFRRNKAIRNEA